MKISIDSWEMRVPYSNHIVCPSVRWHFLCAAITQILFYRELSNFLDMYIGNISDKENTYSFGGHYVKGQGHRQFLWVFYIPFSNATLCCNNWNTFLQRTSKLGQNVCLGRILVKFEYGSSGVCLSTLSLCCDNWNTFVQRTFKLCQNVCLGKILFKFECGSSRVCLSVCLSVCLHFLCAAITGIFLYRELSNFVRMFLWTRSWSTLNISHLGSVCPSAHTFFGLW